MQQFPKFDHFQHKKRKRKTAQNDFELPTFHLDKLNLKEAQKHYQSLQLLHIRGGIDCKTFGFNDVADLFHSNPQFKSTWSVENSQFVGPEEIRPETVLCTNDESHEDLKGYKSWYVSFIAENVGKESDGGGKINVSDRLPLWEPWFLSRSSAVHDQGIWFFVGKNLPSVGRHIDPIRGRPEHTDSMEHTGTWHVQVCGDKIWHLRPHVELDEWQGAFPKFAKRKSKVPKLYRQSKQERKERKGVVATGPRVSRVRGGYEDGRPRLKVHCREGDLLVINTRLWWHSTQVPCTSGARDQISLSYARDFFCEALSIPDTAVGKETAQPLPNTPNKVISCGNAGDGGGDGGGGGGGGGGVVGKTNVDGVYAVRNMRVGDVVLTEDELPDCALPRSEDPNCEVAELADGTGALVAIKPIQAGDWLAVARSDDDDDEEEEEE